MWRRTGSDLHAHFASGGTLRPVQPGVARMVCSYHVERGHEAQHHLVVLPAQAYHGASIATFGLTGQGRTAGPLSALYPAAAAHPAVDMVVRSFGERPAPRALDQYLVKAERSGRGVSHRAGSARRRTWA